MKLLINILLAALVIFLGYLLYANIQEPIIFRDVKNARKDVVVTKLDQIRQSQEIYRNIVGNFANDFDTLKTVLRNDSIEFVKISADPEFPDDPEKFIKEFSYSPAIDSINVLGINLDSLEYVPFSNGTKFNIQADTLTYQKTLVSVVEVGTRWRDFMGEYASPKFSKYDKSYEPAAMLKFGDMNKPSLGGNWK